MLGGAIAAAAAPLLLIWTLLVKLAGWTASTSRPWRAEAIWAGCAHAARSVCDGTVASCGVSARSCGVRATRLAPRAHRQGSESILAHREVQRQALASDFKSYAALPL